MELEKDCIIYGHFDYVSFKSVLSSQSSFLPSICPVWKRATTKSTLSKSLTSFKKDVIFLKLGNKEISIEN